jgi:hypothetical protein
MVKAVVVVVGGVEGGGGGVQVLREYIYEYVYILGHAFPAGCSWSWTEDERHGDVRLNMYAEL